MPRRKAPLLEAAKRLDPAPASATEATPAQAASDAGARAPAPPASAETPVPGAATPADVLPAPDAPSAAPATVEEPGISLSVQEILDRLPTDPGVYLMKDKKGRIIYVGKATNLKNRVRSYFTRSGDTRAFVRLLSRLLGDIETVVTTTEKEALLLENTLIKQHRPRFNVKLVDDKNYLVLRLDPKARYPRLEVTRRIRDDGARYFGPYHSASSCRQTLKVVNRHFKLRTCNDQVLNSRKRPCLQFQIKRCDAPCVLPVPADAYAEQVRDVALFLDGKSEELTGRLRARMFEASEAMEFETAAALRDQLSALGRTLEEQRVVSAQFVDQDVFGYYRQGDVLEITVLFVRQGKLLGRRSFRFSGQEFPDEESISSFVSLYYDQGNTIPDEVLLPVALEDQATKEEWLRERALEAGGRRRAIEVLTPRRGPRAKLVDLACKNAAVSYSTRRDKTRDVEDALAKLQRRLGLKAVPRHIECFDISHLQGSFTVASRVVFLDGEPAKHLYRTFRVRTVTNDDFASMYEVLSRRFRRAVQAGALAKAPPGAAAAAGGDGGERRSSASIATRRASALMIASGSSRSVSEAQDATPAYPADAAAAELGAELDAEIAVPAGAAINAQLAVEPDGDASADLGDGEITEGEGGEIVDADLEEDAGLAAGDGAGPDPWALPDLLVIDGGKGQLATALAALKDVGINWAAQLDVIGLAKEREDQSGTSQPDRVFLPRTKDPIRLRDNTAEMFVLSRIRDEAHRFAVGFHQKQREKRTIRSQLADVPGVGPKRQSALLKALGSVKRIREASLAGRIDELAAVPGMTLRAAQAVADYFVRGGSAPDATAATAPGRSPVEPARTPRPAQVAPRPAAAQANGEEIAENAAERELAALGVSTGAESADAAALEQTLEQEIAQLAAEAAQSGPEPDEAAGGAEVAARAGGEPG